MDLRDHELMKQVRALRWNTEIEAAKMRHRKGRTLRAIAAKIHRQERCKQNELVGALSEVAGLTQTEVKKTIKFAEVYDFDGHPALPLLGETLLIGTMKLLQQGESFEDYCNRQGIDLTDLEDNKKVRRSLRRTLTERLKQKGIISGRRNRAKTGSTLGLRRTRPVKK
jgi:hypothetical protein